MELPSLFCGLDASKIRNSAWERVNNLRNSTRKRIKSRKHLPLGTGPYTVGCADIMSSPSVEGTFLRLYYPTYQTDVFKREAQWPLWLPRKQYGKGYAYFRRKNTKVFGTLMNLIGGDVYVPVLWHAPLKRSQTPYPVIIFSHGMGGNRTTYTTFVSDLASHGFVVAVLEHRDGSASMTYSLEPTNSDPLDLSNLNHLHHRHGAVQQQWRKYERQEPEDDYTIRNKQVKVRATEVNRALEYLDRIADGNDPHNVLSKHFELRQFKGQLNTNCVSIIGHSFGGSTTIKAMTNNKRLKVGVSLDGWMHPLEASVFPQVTQPLLCINADGFHWQQNIDDMLQLGVNPIPQNNNLSNTLTSDIPDESRERVMLTMKGTNHQSFTDFQFLIPSKVGKMMELRGNLDPYKAMKLQVDCTIGFLRKHLGLSNLTDYDYLLRGEDVDLIYGTNLPVKID